MRDNSRGWAGNAVIAVLLTWSAASAAAPLSVETQQARVRANEVTVDLKVEQSQRVGDIQVSSREGSKLAPLPDAVEEAGEATKLTIPADGRVIVSSKAPGPQGKPKSLPSKPAEAPALLLESVEVPGAPELRQIRQWTLVLYSEQTPLVWSSERRAYVTQLLVGLKDAAGGATALGSPMTVQLVGDGVAIEPSRLELSKPGISGLKSSLVALPNHQSEGSVTAISDFGEQSYLVKAAPRLAILDLKPGDTLLPGFGIGKTTLTAVRRAEDGLELADARPLSVLLTATGGRLGDTTLRFEPNSSRSAVTELRSAWLGQARVLAAVGAIQSAPVELTFTAPWGLVLAILLGAALGSYVRTRARHKRINKQELIVGIGVGVILGLGSFVGLSTVTTLPATASVTELGCFLIAALEAYVGLVALDRLANAGMQKSSGPAPT